jgi:hypothetical protein
MIRVSPALLVDMPDFPRLAFDGSLWAAGDPDLVVNGTTIARDGIQPQWLRPSSCVVYSRDSDGALMCVDAPFTSASVPRCLRAAGGNTVAAAGGTWVIFRADPPRLIFDNGVEWPGYSYPALSDDGTLLACLTQSDHTLFAGRPSAMAAIDGAACLNPRWGSSTLCWERGTGSIFGRSTLDESTVPLVVPGSRLFKPVPVWTGQYLYVLTHSDDRVLLAEWGSLARGAPRGTVIAGPGFDGGSAYQHDARALTPSTIRVAYGDNGVIRIVDVSNLQSPSPIPV